MEPVFKVCYVKWRDAAIFKAASEPRHGWYKLDDIQALVDRDWPWMETVGWLVHQDVEKLVISPTVSRYTAGDLMVIPAGMVVELRLLEDPPIDEASGPVPVVVPDSGRLSPTGDEPGTSPATVVIDAKAISVDDSSKIVEAFNNQEQSFRRSWDW